MSAIGEAARSVQASYEGGSISYPRVNADAGLSEVCIEALAGVAAAQGVTFIRGRLPTYSGVGHEALHAATVPDFLQPDSPETSVARRITRHWIQYAAGDAAAEVGCIEGDVPEWLKALEFSRPAATMPNAVLHPEQRTSHTGIVRHSPETIALTLIVDADVGRPSTVVDAAERFVAAGWLGTDGLTPQAWVAAERTPQVLQQPTLCRQIEAALAGAGDMHARYGRAMRLVPSLEPALRLPPDEEGGKRQGGSSGDGASSCTPKQESRPAPLRRRRRISSRPPLSGWHADDVAPPPVGPGPEQTTSTEHHFQPPLPDTQPSPNACEQSPQPRSSIKILSAR